MNISKEEKKKWILENCVDENGNIDLRGLDFSDFDGHVYLDGMKVKNNLYQRGQEIQGHLTQNYQQVKGILFQNCQEVQGHLFQGAQKVRGSLFQDCQQVKGNLWQDKQNVKGKVPQNGNGTADYKRGVVDTEHKYFGGFKAGEVIWIVDFCRWHGFYDMGWGKAKVTIRHFEIKANGETPIVAHAEQLADPSSVPLEQCFKTESEAEAYLIYRIEEGKKLTLKNLISKLCLSGSKTQKDVIDRLRDASVSELEDLLKSIQDEIEKKGGK